MVRVALILLMAGLAGFASGCARSVPAAELGEGGDVGVVVLLKSGESLRGRLLSMTGQSIVVDAYYRIGGDVELVGTSERMRVEVGGAEVEGELMSVKRDGLQRTAVVRRALDPDQVDEATLHRSADEASLGPILSVLVGPALGALLALVI